MYSFFLFFEKNKKLSLFVPPPSPHSLEPSICPFLKDNGGGSEEKDIKLKGNV